MSSNDSKRRYIAGRTSAGQESVPSNTPLPPVTPFEVDEALSKLLTVMQREVHNLLIASAGGKLLPEHSRDLVQYIKLLSEVSVDQKEMLANMTEDQLKNLLK
jgi:hypothetical protein